MSAPDRIWLGSQKGESFDVDCWSATAETMPDAEWVTMAEYILATPEALAASPEVQALIEAAVMAYRGCVMADLSAMGYAEIAERICCETNAS